MLLSLIGLLRWVFVVPPLADSYMAGDATTKVAVAAAWMAQHQFGGALLGEHLGQLLAIGWSVTVSALALRTRMLPRWVGWTGLVASALYLTGQGDILATAVPGFPVWDLGGLLGSTLWACGCWPWGWPCCGARPRSPRPAPRATRRSRRRPERALARFPDPPFRGAVGWTRLRDVVEDTGGEAAVSSSQPPSPC